MFGITDHFHEPCDHLVLPQWCAERADARRFKHEPVGEAAYGGGPQGSADFVTLKANGGTASVGFAFQDAHSYQRSYCVPRRVNGLSIQFASPSSFYLRTPNWLACKSIGLTSVEGVTRGIANYH